jgi:hypothetical protein
VLKRLKYPVLSAKKWKNGEIWVKTGRFGAVWVKLGRFGAIWCDLVEKGRGLVEEFAKRRPKWRDCFDLS